MRNLCARSTTSSMLSLLLMAVVGLGCGDDETGVSPDGSTQQDGSISSPDGNMPDGSAGNPDGSTQMDGSTSDPDGSTSDGSAPDGSVSDGSTDAMDAGAMGVQCEDEFCDPDSEKCCVTEQGGQPSGMCIANNAQCDGLTADCDGAEDCPGSEVCCGTLETGTSCAASCEDSFQVCNDVSDCEAGDACCTFMGVGACFASCGF